MKKYVSFLLTLAMLLSLSVPVFADETSAGITVSVNSSGPAQDGSFEIELENPTFQITTPGVVEGRTLSWTGGDDLVEFEQKSIINSNDTMVFQLSGKIKDNGTTKVTFTTSDEMSTTIDLKVNLPTVTFFDENGNEFYKSITVGNKVASMPETPTKTGYTFDGWWFSYEKKVKGRTIPKTGYLTEDTVTDSGKLNTVYAKWTKLPEATVGDKSYDTVEDAVKATVAAVDASTPITITAETTIGSTTVAAGSTVTVADDTGTAAASRAATVTPKTLTISKGGEENKTVKAYVVKTSDEAKSAVVTDVKLADESDIVNDTAPVENLVNVAQVLANAVAEKSIDVSSISSMTLRLDKKGDTTSATLTGTDGEAKTELQTKLSNTSVTVYDVKPIATVTTATTTGETTTTQSYEYDASKEVTGSFTFKLNVGTSADAGKTANLTHYHEESGNWTATAISGTVDGSGDVTVTLDKFSYISVDSLTAPVVNTNDDDYSYTPSTSRPTTTTITDEETPLSAFPIFYVDVAEDSWYHDAIAYVTALDLMNGVGDDRFDPNANTTRGMVAVVMMRLAQGEAIDSESFFDVADDAYYAEAAAWAVENGVYVGFDDGSFRGELNILREQFAAVLYRYATAKGYDVSGKAELGSFTDSASVSGYAADAMAWAVESGIIEGVGDNLLDPLGNATRAQLATMLMRFHALYTAEV